MTTEKKQRAMKFTVPPSIAAEIVAISKQLGMQQAVVRAWVAETVFDRLNVRAIVEAGITQRLAEDQKAPSAE